MKKKDRIWAMLAFILVFMQCIVCMAATNTGMKVSAPVDNGYISNVDVDFYFLGNDAYPESFKNCGVDRDFGKNTADKAKKLWDFIANKNIQKAYTVKTQGKAVEVDSVKVGYYLYGAKDVKIEKDTYHFVPAIVYLADDGMSIEMKHSVETEKTPQPQAQPTPQTQNPVKTVPVSNPQPQGKLPQTGQDWVTVVVFAGIGVLLLGGCLVYAIIINRGKKWNKVYCILAAAGIACLVYAAYLLSGNLQEDEQAQRSSAEIMEMLKEEQEENQAEEDDVFMQDDEDEDLGDGSDDEMDVIMDGDTAYVGTIVLPKLGVELPVAAELSYPQLRISPCRYKGTILGNSMIIAAHNYNSHFGGIKNVKDGDKAQFVDVHGNVYNYEAVKSEILKPNDFDGMDAGDWDLTLFTCTKGGAKRVTVRYKLVSTEEE